jgi:uncharacterized protein (UPF0147 family)
VTPDLRYDHVLAAAMVILDEMDQRPAMPKHDLLSLIVFSMLTALDAMDDLRMAITPSAN